MLFHMIPFFFLSMVAQKTSKLRYSDWLLRNFNQSESGYLSYHGEQNGGHHAKEHWNLSWKLVSKNSLHFVGSHHSEKQTVTEEVAYKLKRLLAGQWVAQKLCYWSSYCRCFQIDCFSTLLPICAWSWYNFSKLWLFCNKQNAFCWKILSKIFILCLC